jgi:hypothetical protein
MAGWMGEWMYGWTDGWEGGWMDGWMDGWMEQTPGVPATQQGLHSAYYGVVPPWKALCYTRKQAEQASKNASPWPLLSSCLCVPVSVLFFFFFHFFIGYLAHLHFQCYTKSPPYPPTPTPLPTHSPFLALAFPCTGAYKVCMSNGF